MKPFLKWAGGKRWLVSGHGELFRTGSRRLVEPFAGSAAVFFHMEPESAVLADANVELVETYCVVRDDPSGVETALREHQARHSADHYYEVRSQSPGSPVERAARLIYLNRTCFNALYRVNRRGEFNVPKGSKDSVVHKDDDFVLWSRVLAVAEIVAQDFELTISNAGAGDLLYVDPPYTVKHNNNNFVKYNEHMFSWSDQERLARCLAAAAERGALIILSNADHESIIELYPDDVWNQMVVGRHSVLASSSSRRRPTTELVVSNFPIVASD